MMGAIEIDPSFVPQTPADLLACLASWEWRIFSGQLYKIMTKGADDAAGETTIVVPFKPNRAQRRFLKRLHYRNVILKARQLGFTTLIAILWLDHALFNADQRCGIIAHTREDAEVIFRDKVKFAYDHLPDTLRMAMPLKKDTQSELVFGHNNSAIRVATSLRSGTYQRLHISEMGKVAAKFPEKAKEIVTGSLPTVPADGVAIIESTAEGQGGEFYNISIRAERLAQIGVPLTPAQFRFHFFPWHSDAAYQMDPRGVVISATEHEYFDAIEADQGVIISNRQRAWYISKRDTDFSGDPELMWREYPSTSSECWQQSTEGSFLHVQLARARMEGRITRLPVSDRVKVNTFWDIGSSAGTAIWLHQHVGAQDRFFRFIEGWDEGYLAYVKRLRDLGYLYGTHFLPHDAVQQRQMMDRIGTPLEMLQELAPDWTFSIVPRTETFQHGMDLMRSRFSSLWFDEEGCKEGLEHLALYKKRWNARLGVWSSEPDKDNPHTEAADALRQWAQGYDPALESMPVRPKRSRRGGMAS